MNQVNGWRTAVLALLLTMMLVKAAPAQQPTVVVSIRSIDELLDDADFIGAELGKEGIREQVEGLLNAVTAGKEFAGIDLEKSLGLFLNATGGPTDMPVVFIPVSDADGLKGLVKSLTPDFKDDKGQWSFTVNDMKIYGKIANGYLFASPVPALLSKLPDPKKIVNDKYDVALEISLASIPASLVQAFLNQAEENGRNAMRAGPDPASKGEELGREFGFEGALAVLKSLGNDGDKITLGYDLNSKTRLGSIDASVTAKPNSGLAKSLASLGKITPLFAGLGAETAPLRLVLSYPTVGISEQLNQFFDAIHESISDEIKKSDDLDTDAKKDVANGFVVRIIDIMKATAKTGSMHSGLVLDSGEGGKLRIVTGSKVAKGDDANKVIDDLLNLLKDHPDIADVKLDVAKVSGGKIHSVDPQKKDDDAEKYFGDGPLHLAVRNDIVWLSLGVDNLTALKKSLEQAAKTATRTAAPISLQIKPGALVALMENDDEDLIERAKEVAGKPGDKLNLEIVPVASGAKLRLEFGVDLLGLAPQEEEDK